MLALYIIGGIVLYLIIGPIVVYVLLEGLLWTVDAQFNLYNKLFNKPDKKLVKEKKKKSEPILCDICKKDIQRGFYR